MRDQLPTRRRGENFEITHDGQSYTITTGFYRDNRVGEVFISTTKSGTTIDALARDIAILISLSLQHGCPLEVIRHAITRDSMGNPSTIGGAVIDRLMMGDGPHF